MGLHTVYNHIMSKIGTRMDPSSARITASTVYVEWNQA